MEYKRNIEMKENKLRYPSEQGLGFLNDFSDCVLVIARDYRILAINEKGLEHYNLTRSEVLKRYYFNTNHLNHSPTSSELHTCPLGKVFETGESITTRQTHHTEAGELVVKAQAFPLTDDSGEITRAIVFLQNVTAQRQAESIENLAKKAAAGTITELEQLRLLLDNINMAFWITDWVNDKVLYISPSYEAIWGYSRESLYDEGWSWSANVHPEDRARIVDAFNTNAPLGTYDEVYRIIRNDGKVRWIHDRAFMIPNEEGGVWLVAGVSEDVTDSKNVISG